MYGSHDEFLVLLFFRVLIFVSSESCVSVFDWSYLSSTCLRKSHHDYDRKFAFFLSLIINFAGIANFSHHTFH